MAHGRRDVSSINRMVNFLPHTLLAHVGRTAKPRVPLVGSIPWVCCIEYGPIFSARYLQKLVGMRNVSQATMHSQPTMVFVPKLHLQLSLFASFPPTP